jgi:hypothetical protein
MTGQFTRGLLSRQLGNPRLVAEMEETLDLLKSTRGEAELTRTQLAELARDLGDGGKYQRAAGILEAISGLPNRIGVMEITGEDMVVVRPVDSKDPASLLSRGVSYTVLVGIAGRGTTAERPTLPENAVGLYFDTTLAAAGKPVFWTGAAWVDATGTVV